MRALAAAAALLLVGVVVAGLTTAVPDVQAEPFAPRVSMGPPEPYRLPMGRLSDGVLLRQLGFAVTDAAALARADELRLVLSSYDARPEIFAASLEIDGTGCRFVTAPGPIDQNQPRSFRRAAACAVPPGRATATFTAELGARTQREGQLAIWMVRVPHYTLAATQLLRIDGDDNSLVPAGGWRRDRGGPDVARMALLAFMWERPAWHLWGLLALAGVLLAAAGVALAGPSRSGLATAAAGAAVAAGLTLCFVVIVPPLQAPDEPDHLLSFSHLTGREALAAEASAWARRIHFDRIAFRHLERFRPGDREQPYERAWDTTQVSAEDVARRATAASRYWRTIAPIVPDEPAAALLTLRLLNAAVFSLAAGLAVLLVARTTTIGAPALAMLPLLAIPTLPFFAMHVSELTWTIAGWTVLTACAIALLAGGRSPWLGAALGVVAALVLSGPRSAWPLAALIGVLLAARVFAAPSASVREAAAFWAACVAPAALAFGTGLLAIPSPEFDRWRDVGFTPPGGVGGAWVVVGALGVFGAGTALERGLEAVDPAGQRLRITAAACAGIALLTAIWIAGVLVISPFVRLPVLPPQHLVASGVDYVSQVMAVMATVPRLSGHDHLLWVSFVGAFGWIDTLLPATLVSGLTMLFSLGAIGMLVWLVVRRDGRRGTWALALLAGLAASTIVCAAAAFTMHRSLHGRYVIGVYVVALGLAGALPALTSTRDRAPRWTALVLAGLCAVHAVSLTTLLERYFE